MGILLFAEIQEILLDVLQSPDTGIENESLLVSTCFSLLQSNFPYVCQALRAPVLGGLNFHCFKAEGSEFQLLSTAGVVRIATFSVHLLANDFEGVAHVVSE